MGVTGSFVGCGAIDGAGVGPTVGIGAGGAGSTIRAIPLTAMSSPPATSIAATASAGKTRSLGRAASADVSSSGAASSTT